VLNVTAGAVHYTWATSNVIVHFRMLAPLNGTKRCYDLNRCETGREGRTVIEAVHDLTDQAQTRSSKLYMGNVTDATDPHFGLVARDWDASLRLMYAIEVYTNQTTKDRAAASECWQSVGRRRCVTALWRRRRRRARFSSRSPRRTARCAVWLFGVLCGTPRRAPGTTSPPPRRASNASVAKRFVTLYQYPRRAISCGWR
jgi:hypothetical protein